MIRLLVCGSRTFDDRELIETVVAKFIDRYGMPEAACHGAARGADSIAATVISSYGVPVEEFPAYWDSEGRSAGFKRNQRMLDEFQPTHVIAFYDGMKSTGTAMMVRLARAAGVLACEMFSYKNTAQVTKERRS